MISEVLNNIIPKEINEIQNKKIMVNGSSGNDRLSGEKGKINTPNIPLQSKEANKGFWQIAWDWITGLFR